LSGTKKELHSFRPAARHILTIGRDLIKDSLAALLELVKNSYDADASVVQIIFTAISKEGEDAFLKIVIKDNGHGMSYDTVVKKWMIPSTDDKLRRRYSPGERLMQGRKGIGRYAAAILGDEMLMETVDKNSTKTQVLVNWKDFEIDIENKEAKEKYLDEIEILVESFPSEGEESGTSLELTGGDESLSEWSSENIDLLIKELRKLMSPIAEVKKDDPFEIQLTFKDFPVEKYRHREIEIEPFGVIELFDYRLSGDVKKVNISDLNIADFPERNKFINEKEKALKKGIKSLIVAGLKFENKSTPGIKDEIFMDVIELNEGIYCGEIQLDVRVFDREADSIENLIQKGLKNPESGEYMGKREARKLLNEMCGVSIYRGGFRIRPYGEPGYDWLELDKRRVQDPTRCIGLNQIIGFITIQEEEKSHLEEKSARDGLKETIYYLGLKDEIIQALLKLEDRRYQFRLKTGKGRRPLKIEKEFQKIVDLSGLEQNLLKVFRKSGVSKDIQNKIIQVIHKTKAKTAEVVDSLKDTIARYEGHITLGKIIMVLLHEGRKPLDYFKNQIPNLLKYINLIGKEDINEIYSNIKTIADDLLEQTTFLIRLFNRLEPLAVRKRRKKKFLLKNLFNRVMMVFEREIQKNNIRISMNIEGEIELSGWEEDFYIIFTNLIENSLYWLPRSHKKEKLIKIHAFLDDGELVVDFIDNGPGIEKQYIDQDRIFEPGFSTKKNGTGLGLPISGEAASRNNGELTARYSEDGAYLRARFKLEGKKDDESENT
jgi:signal transduction histidine kinase